MRPLLAMVEAGKTGTPNAFWAVRREQVSRVGIERTVEEPRVFGPYEVLQRIGEGTMGRVYMARHQRIGRQVALKILRPEHSHNIHVVQRFFQEAQAANQINCEHIVEVFDLIEEETSSGTRAAIVMELLKGSSLKAELHAGRVSISRAARVVRQVCSALQAAHERGIVHRDIKPDNIYLIERTGQLDFVKVLDFGVAKLIRPLLDSTAPGTMAGAIIGTPSYMSPEQASGGAVDWRADVYAVGALLYTVLAGKPPFDGNNLGTIVLQIVHELPPLLPEVTERGERVPEALRDLIDACLAKDPGARPQSMQELGEALVQFEAEPTQAPELMTRPWRWMAAGLALAIALGGGAWAYVERDGLGSAPAELPTPVRALAPAPPPPSPPPPELPRQATLTVNSQPPGARVVRMDTGAELGTTPFAQTLDRTSKPLRLRVELGGYDSVEREVVLDRDTGADFTMMPKRPPDTRRPAPARKSEKTRDAVLNPYAE
jgi:serine/threonine protein kinase